MLGYLVYVALHLYGLWDQRRRMRTVLCIAIAVLYIPVLSIVSLGLKTLYSAFLYLYLTCSHLLIFESIVVIGDTMFLSALHTCILSGNDTFTKVAFGCMVSSGSLPNLSRQFSYHLRNRNHGSKCIACF